MAAPTPNYIPVTAAPPTQLVDRVNLGMQLRRYWKLFTHRWFIVLLCVLVGTGYMGYKAYTIVDTYGAFAELALAMKVAKEGGGPTVIEPAFVERQLYNMQSSQLHAKIQEILDKEAEVEGTPGKWKHIGISPAANTGAAATFRLSATSTNAAYVAKYVQTWAKEFLNFRQNEIDQTYGKELVSTIQQINLLEKEETKARKELEDFQKTNNLATVRDALNVELKRYGNAVENHDAIVAQLRRLKATTEQEIAEGAFALTAKPLTERRAQEAVAANPDKESIDLALKFPEQSDYRKLTDELRGLTAQWKRYEQTLKPKHDLMVELAERIKAKEAEIKFQLGIIATKRENSIKDLEQQEKFQSQLVEESKARVTAMGSIDNEFKRLDAEINRVMTSLAQERQRKFDIQMVNNEKQPQFTVQNPGSPAAKTPQKKSKLIFNGFFAGLVVGIAIIYFLHRLDDRLELAEDIADVLEQPVLGQVPLVETKSKTAGQVIITRLHQHDMFAESLRGVRSCVILGVEEGTRKVLMVSSAVPGDGKTTFTVNFAATLAIAGHRVLLVDADLRRGNTHGYFGYSRENGLVDVLTGSSHWSDVLKETELKTLQVITSGKIPPNPGELLGGAPMAQFIKEARDNFDFVVVDCPPLTGLDDTFVLLNHSDGLLFVVRAGQTSMRFARAAINAVNQRGGRLLGVVLNGITADNPYYYYNYYYHSYYNKADQEPMVPVGSIPQPAQQMAAPRTPRYKTMSIEAVARVRTVGERPSSSQIGEEERVKAVAYKARRASRLTTASVPGSRPAAPPASPAQPPPEGDKAA